MKIVVIQNSMPDHALISTSLVAGIRKKYGQFPIIWMTNPDSLCFFKYINGVSAVNINSNIDSLKYHTVINLTNSDQAIKKSSAIDAENYYGFCDKSSNPDIANQGEDFLNGSKSSKQNMFQIFYGIAGLSWRGEGYGFGYFPKTKKKDGRIGMAIFDKGIKKYLKNNLDIPANLIWDIPIRENHNKQFNEINCCEDVITDNSFIMHASLCLRKRTEFLCYEKPNVKLEFFGKGQSHIVPEKIKSLALGL